MSTKSAFGFGKGLKGNLVITRGIMTAPGYKIAVRGRNGHTRLEVHFRDAIILVRAYGATTPPCIHPPSVSEKQTLERRAG